MDEKLLCHIIEIRKRIIYILMGFLLVFIPAFHFDNWLYGVFAKPLLANLPSGTKLISIDITSPFLVPMKLAAMTALILSMPIIFYQLWQFLSPGMYKTEKKLFLFIVPSTIVLFILGCLFCYFLVLPVIFSFIAHIKSPEINMMTDMGKYLDFIISLFLIFGLCFQMPILIFMLVHLGLISQNQLKKFRRYMFVLVFIIGAVLAPPDIISQTMLAIPLYLLYEIGLFLTTIIK